MSETPKRSEHEINTGPSINLKAVSNHFLSDNDQTISEHFNPVPYCFVLKDAQGICINLPRSRNLNARVECPGFHVLLDHLLAVLWIFYSRKNLDMLESSHIHWALKVLEGTKNKQCYHTEDVRMAMDHLTDAYIDVCANADISKQVKQNHEKDPRCRESSIEKHGIPDQDALKNASLHLADLVSGADASVLEELLAGMNKSPSEEEICVEPRKLLGENDLTNEQNNMLTIRNHKFREVVSLIEEIKRLDNSLLRNSSEHIEQTIETASSNIGLADAATGRSNEDNMAATRKISEDDDIVERREMHSYDPRMFH